jgi:hypothetical protein
LKHIESAINPLDKAIRTVIICGNRPSVTFSVTPNPNAFKKAG